MQPLTHPERGRPTSISGHSAIETMPLAHIAAMLAEVALDEINTLQIKTHDNKVTDKTDTSSRKRCLRECVMPSRATRLDRRKT